MSDTTASPPAIIPTEAVTLMPELPRFVELLPLALQPYWTLIQSIPAVEAVVIIGIFYCLAFLVRKYAINTVHKLTSRTSASFDDQIIETLRKPIFNFILWVGVIIGAQSAGFTEGVFRFIAPIIMTLMVITVSRAALSIASILIAAMSREPNRFHSVDLRTEPLLVIVSKILILLIAAYAALMIWGINPVGLLASAGVVGIAVGFAAKDTLANLFSGMFILADRPYKLGDYILLESGERGKVTHIGIRSTRILTRDDIEVTVPNGVIGNAKVVNESGGSHIKMRIRVDVQCAYNADLEYVEEMLLGIATAHPDLCDFPAPRIRFRQFADSGINIQVIGWIDEPELRGRVIHSMIKAIHRAFKDHNLEIPFPKRDITITHQNANGSS